MNSHTTWVKLRDVCETTSGGTPSRDVLAYYGGDIPWVKSGELLDGLITDTEEKITKAALASSSAKLFPAGTLLIALYGATVGRLGILGIEATTNQAICGITPKEQLDRDFLFYYLLKQRDKLIESRTGGAQPNINQEIIRELDIPLPPLTEQKRIASLLRRADRLRQLRRTAHDLSASVLQSVFLEMFGDPISNIKYWEQATIKELGKVVTGSTPPSEVEGMFGGSIPFITPGDLTVDTLKSQRYVTEEGAKKSRVVRTGSTLVCCIGATIGKTDMAKTKCAFNQQINAIEWNENIQDDFGLTTMKFFSRIVAERGISTTLPILKKSEFEEIVIPVPPLNLQEEFSRLLAKVENMKYQDYETERQTDILFQSLLSQAFESHV